MSDDPEASLHAGWIVFGSIAGLIFYSRFYVQWIYSEIEGKSTVPPVFWYQSALGSVMLLVYAILTQSPLGALSQSLNLVPYSRNMIFIWEEQGVLTKRLHRYTHIVVGVIACIGVSVVIWLWLREYLITRNEPVEQMRRTWLWLFVGVAGQGLFASRFIIQWAATEYRKKSHVPTVFWYISLAASVLMCAAFIQRGEGEWVYAAGLIANMLIYARNIWMIHRRGPGEDEETSA